MYVCLLPWTNASSFHSAKGGGKDCLSATASLGKQLLDKERYEGGLELLSLFTSNKMQRELSWRQLSIQHESSCAWSSFEQILWFGLTAGEAFADAGLVFSFEHISRQMHVPGMCVDILENPFGLLNCLKSLLPDCDWGSGVGTMGIALRDVFSSPLPSKLPSKPRNLTGTSFLSF